jgi:hypothetical protein
MEQTINRVPDVEKLSLGLLSRKMVEQCGHSLQRGESVTLAKCLCCDTVDVEENFNMCVTCHGLTCDKPSCAGICPCNAVQSQN